MSNSKSTEIRIVAAAVRLNGHTFTGDRHGHIIKYLVQIGQLKERDGMRDKVSDEMQGFMDSNGVFLTRTSARGIAVAAGQIKLPHGILYSEDLW